MMNPPRNQRLGTPQISTSTSTSTSPSPFARNTIPGAPRSPIRASGSGRDRQELGLSLKQVIGTTCQSVTCFDYLPSLRSFTFTAGAAAVVATVDEDNKITQRFFRANPVQSSQRTAFSTGGLAREAYATPDGRHKEHDRPEWGDSPTGNKAAGVRERVKAATAVSFSPNGRFLAVGETGYRPRVLIFSLAEKASAVDSPLSVISEHTFGVQAVAFSPDSKHLASLGTINDGFLFIWSIDEKTGAANLVASNKCTNTIRQMTWMGCNVVTVGLRFIKVWRPNDLPPSVNENSERGYGLYNRQHKPLAGRNTLLGDLLEASFTCVAAISDTQAIICTDGGDVCILDDTDKNQRLTRVANMDFSIMAVCIGPTSQVIVTGLEGKIRALDLEELTKSFIPPDAPSFLSKTPSASLNSYHFVALGAVGNTIVTVDNLHSIQLRPVSSRDIHEHSNQALRRLPAHCDAVLGVRALSASNDRDIAFITWSANGTIIFWSAACEAKRTIHVPMDQSVDMYNVINELKTVVTFSSASHAVTGDRYGVLRITDVDTGEGVSSVRAHSGEITDIALHEGSRHTLVASSSRDRTLQLFTWTADRLDLLQTLDEHAGSATCVLFAKDGNQLLSCSSDRTVVLREAVERDDDGPPIFVIIRTITLKNSPTSMRMSLFPDTVLLSATDRSIQLLSTRSGRVISSFKANDTEGGDAVVMSSLVHLPSTAGSPIIAGVASSDKSVRLYSEDGTLLARDWGHTEGVTDIALLKSHDAPGDLSAMKLITVAADGTIFIWSTVPERPRSRDSDIWGLQVPSFASSAPGVVSAEQPLRKVISHSEIARFQRSKSADIDNIDMPTSPTSAKEARNSTGLKKKSSRLSIRPPPKLEPSPLSTIRNGSTVKSRQRSPSPTPPSPRPSSSPRTQRTLHGKHRLSVGGTAPVLSTLTTEKGTKDSGKSENGTGFGSVAASTEQLSRMLRAYRQKLDTSCAGVSIERLRELEKELEITRLMVQRPLGTDKEKSLIDKGSSEVETSMEGNLAEGSGASRSTSSHDASFISAQAEQDVGTMGGAEDNS